MKKLPHFIKHEDIVSIIVSEFSTLKIKIQPVNADSYNEKISLDLIHLKANIYFRQFADKYDLINTSKHPISKAIKLFLEEWKKMPFIHIIKDNILFLLSKL